MIRPKIPGTLRRMLIVREKLVRKRRRCVQFTVRVSSHRQSIANANAKTILVRDTKSFLPQCHTVTLKLVITFQLIVFSKIPVLSSSDTKQENHSTREYGVVGRDDMFYIFMLCSCRLNKCSISYWQSIMNFNTINQQIEMIIMKNRWLYSLLLVSIIYLVLFYFNFTAYIGDYLEDEKYGFCIHCNGSVMCGTCKCARTLLHWIVKWWQLSILHTLYSILSDSTLSNKPRR